MTRTTTLGLDRRGVSEVIGGILMFAVVVMLLSIMQMQLVPAANEGVEFQHNQQVQEDFSELHAAMSRSATRGGGESVSVQLGMTYPTRMLFFNPPPVSGSLRTTEKKAVRIQNVEGLDQDVQEYLSSLSSPEFETRLLTYSAHYNRYDRAPSTQMEYGILYRNYSQEDRTIIEDSGTLIDGRQISLTLLSGTVSETSVGTTSTQVQSVNGPTETVLVRSDGSNLTLSIYTRLSENAWENITADERYVSDVRCTNAAAEPSDPCMGELELELWEEENGNSVVYELRVPKVSVDANQRSFDHSAYYTATVNGDGAHIRPGETLKVTVQVRDKFNNPVSGVAVRPYNQSNRLKPVGDNISDSEGKVSYYYAAPLSGGLQTFNIGYEDSKRGLGEFSVQVEPADDGAAPVIKDFEATTTAEHYLCESKALDTSDLACSTYSSVERVNIDFTVADAGSPPSGIDYVRIVAESGSTNITEHSVVVDSTGGTDYTGQVTTSWTVKSNEEIDTVYIEVYDKSGYVNATSDSP